VTPITKTGDCISSLAPVSVQKADAGEESFTPRTIVPSTFHGG